MSKEIIWHQNGTGYIMNFNTPKCLVYTPEYGVKIAIDNYIHYICQHPLSIQQVMNKLPVDGPPLASTNTIYFSLAMIRPEPGFLTLTHLIKDCIHEYLYNEITNNHDDSSDISFIIKASAIRDWTSNCSICLEDKIGVPLGWNDSCAQITLFRPCYHSVCSRCNNGLTICPLCRQPIIKFIEHKHPRFNDDVINQLADKVWNQFYDKSKLPALMNKYLEIKI